MGHCTHQASCTAGSKRWWHSPETRAELILIASEEREAGMEGGREGGDACFQRIASLMFPRYGIPL